MQSGASITMMATKLPITIAPIARNGRSGSRWRFTHLLVGLMQHTVSKGFKRIRYYGVQTTKTFAQVKMGVIAPFPT